MDLDYSQVVNLLKSKHSETIKEEKITEVANAIVATYGEVRQALETYIQWGYLTPLKRGGYTVELLMKRYKMDPISAYLTLYEYGKNPEKTVNQLDPQDKKTSDQQDLNSEGEINYPKSFLIPVKDIIKSLEDYFKGRVIVYYIPDKSQIDQEHVDYFLDLFKNFKFSEKVFMIVESRGGDPNASLRIATLAREFCKQLTIIVPSVCAGAATQLALSADQIFMSAHGYLTSIDCNLFHELNPRLFEKDPISNITCDSYKKVLKLLSSDTDKLQQRGIFESPNEILFKYIHPLVIGELDRLSKRSQMIAVKMMNKHPQSFESESEINNIASRLVNDYPDHKFPILFEEARRLRLPVEKLNFDITVKIYDLLKYYKKICVPAVSKDKKQDYHQEENTVILESSEKRLLKRISLDRYYDKEMQKWINLEKKSRWIKTVLDGDYKDPRFYKTTPADT